MNFKYAVVTPSGSPITDTIYPTPFGAVSAFVGHHNPPNANRQKSWEQFQENGWYVALVCVEVVESYTEHVRLD